MEEPDQKARLQLAQAQELFNKGEYEQSKKMLEDIKMAHLSIELNSLLCTYKNNPAEIAIVFQKIMDIRVSINVKLYSERSEYKNRKISPRPPHEFYFWNILVLSQLLNNPEVAELITNEALQYADAMRTETSLMIIYQSLKNMEANSRLTSCIGLIEKQNKLVKRVKKLTKQQQTYRFMNHILYCKVLLKLGMIEDGKTMYMMKFKQNEEEPSEDQVSVISDIPATVHQTFLHAQIEYHDKKYQQALKLLSQLLPKIENLPKQKAFIKALIDHNVALVLLQLKKTGAGIFMMQKTLTLLKTSKELQGKNQVNHLIDKCRDNLLLATLMNPNSNYQKAYEELKSHPNCYSFKVNYRKAQLCLEFYHKMLKNTSKVLPFDEIHDFYQTLYFYPNLPYFQQKGKNKNPYHANKKYHYRRYIISQTQKSSDEDLKENKNNLDDKSKNRTSSEELNEEEQEENPLLEVLKTCEWFLKEALLMLEREKNIIVNLNEEKMNLTGQVNEYSSPNTRILHTESITFKSSIYCLLCYVFLCQQQYTQTIHYASLYQAFQKQHQLQNKTKEQQDICFKILTYKTEAYSKLNRTDKAYEMLHDTLAAVDYADNRLITCVSTGQSVFLEQMTTYNNFAHNLSVLHSRENKIPEAYNSIQKLLQQLRLIPTNPQANIPLSLIELLIHYNLRTGNQSSALQLLKRRRILNLPGVMGQYPTLNITK